MSLVSTMYLGLSAAQQRLLGDLVSQGVRILLREGPAIDAAMAAARRRAAQHPAWAEPQLRLMIEVEVVEFEPDQRSGVPTLRVEGGMS
jgi:hypothetical protein